MYMYQCNEIRMLEQLICKLFKVHLQFTSKRMQQFVTFVRHFSIRNCAALLLLVREALGYGVVALFVVRAEIFCQPCHNSANAVHSQKLYKTEHCGAAIKVRHFWWEKSVAHAAMFSSAAVARLLHSL